MPTINYKKLEERIPSLVDTTRIISRSLGGYTALDRSLIRDFCNADLLMEEGILENRLGDIETAVEILDEYLSKLISLDKSHPELKIRYAMKEYLIRLKNFADQNDNINNLFRDYENEFGGEK